MSLVQNLIALNDVLTVKTPVIKHSGFLQAGIADLNDSSLNYKITI